MNKFLLGTALLLALSIHVPSHAHCGVCGEEDNHTEASTDPLHAKENHLHHDLIDTAAKNNDFTTLLQLLETSGLQKALKEKGSFTLLAPTNAAFEALPAGQLESLFKPENKEQLQSLLKYHVIQGNVLSKDIVAGPTNIDTLDGTTVKVSKGSEGVTFNNVAVVNADILATNGVVHAVDRVVMP